jgi:hypothetical protein
MMEGSVVDPGQNRLRVWLGAAALIILPLIAMKIIEPRSWAIQDFPFALIMVTAIGAAFELAWRLPTSWAYSAGAAVAIATSTLLVLGNLAVGFAGSENNSINLVFFLVPTVLAIGSVAVRFRAAGLSTVLKLTAALQLALGLFVFTQGHFTGPLTVAFTGLWLAASVLFRRSAHSA